jgi:hypothetical protein
MTAKRIARERAVRNTDTSNRRAAAERAAATRTRSNAKRLPARRRKIKQGAAERRRNGAPKVTPTVFISYRHEPPTTAISRRLYTALVPAAEVWNAAVFMDDHDLEPADLFDQKIIQALDRTTHFVVLLTNSYWSSPYCRKELARIVDRFQADRSVRLLFVKVDELDPNHFIFNRDRPSGDSVIDKIGDVQFLGPFNDQLQLVRIVWENPAVLGDQIAHLIRRLERVIAK